MEIVNLAPIWEYEESEDSDLRLEKIFEFLFEDAKETLNNGQNNNFRADLPPS